MKPGNYFGLINIINKGSFINHVDGILDIFDPPPPFVDQHGFLANPPKNHVGFEESPLQQ